jgi:hypothetical protein
MRADGKELGAVDAREATPSGKMVRQCKTKAAAVVCSSKERK